MKRINEIVIEYYERLTKLGDLKGQREILQGQLDFDTFLRDSLKEMYITGKKDGKAKLINGYKNN